MSRTRGPLFTPAIVLSSLALSLGLTAIGDTEALAGKGDPREHSRLAQEDDPTELRVLDWTLWNVSKYYVESDRVDPRAMTMAGLEALEQAIPEVLVQAVGEGKVKVRVGTTEREFAADANALWAVGPQVREVFAFVNDHAELSVDEQREAEYAIIEGVLSTLDPHTNLLRPDAFEDMRTNTSGHFGGLGIEVGMRDNEITVIRVLDGNPAAAAGMKAGDRIVQIDEESTVTMTLDEAVGMMRGAAGSEVDLFVRREGVEKTMKFTIERAMIKLDSVIGEILPGKDAQGNEVKVGLIQIPRNFAQTTGTELREKLAEFEKAKVTGIVLDMRDNPGGLLNAAVEVADAFVDAGTIVATVGESAPREESKATNAYQFADTPLVVLVDQGSASATEIVAGALRNLDRAVIVGRRTFGKGSVQVLHDRKVADSELALKLTIAQYLVPGDESIQSVGVSPDLETIPVYVGKDYLAYYGRKRFDLVREESLSSHLENGATQQQQITAGPLYFLQQGSVGDGSALAEADEAALIAMREQTDKRTELLLQDPEIRMARDLVIWAPSSRRSDILAKLPGFAELQTKLEDTRIAKSLASKSIDWSEGPAPAAGTAAQLRMTIATDKPGDQIRGGEVGTLTVTITNTGTAPAYRVRAVSTSDYGYFDERELMFGKLEPGETRTAELKLSVAAHELSRTDRIDFEVHSQHETALSPESKTSIDVAALGGPRPKFAFGYQIVDDPDLKGVTGNGDGLLQVGERVRLRVWAQNVGAGVAPDARVQLRNGSGEAVFLHSGRGKLGELKLNGTGEVELDFEVQKLINEVELQITVSDNKIGEYVTEEITVPVRKPLEFSASKQGATASSALDLYASPDDAAPRIGLALSGTKLASLGSAEGWHKIDLGEGHVGFARADALDLGGSAPRKPGKIETLYAVSPPQIRLESIVGQTSSERMVLRGTATDAEQLRDLYITVYNPSRDLFGSAEKVFYTAASDPKSGKLEFEAEIPLEPGNNIIEVYARENEQVTGVERMWVLRTSGLAEARQAEAKLDAGGKLPVDTFSPR
ncbi:MXAN_5808 family serine peptidase [Nannocystaceae bacterium ST9]